MISSEDYRANPCAVLSIPYWKYKNITLPDNIKIVHDTKFSAAYLEKYTDEIYFRLYHALENIPKIVLNDYEIATATKNDIMAFVDIINQSYTDLAVSYFAKKELSGGAASIVGRQVGCHLFPVGEERGDSSA